jgi:hypothetical protein
VARQVKVTTQWAQTADGFAQLHLKELARSDSDCLEHDRDAVAVATMDRERPSEREPSTNSEVHKLPGLRRPRDIGGGELEHPHAARDLVLPR